VPPGRVSTLTVIDGFALWNAVAREFANFVAIGSFPPAMREMLVVPGLLLVLHPTSVRAKRARPLRVAVTRVAVVLVNMNTSLYLLWRSAESEGP
jgi:hypothetical protein